MTRDEAFKKLDEALAHGAKNGWSPDWFGGRSSAEALRVLVNEVEKHEHMHDGADVGVTPYMVQRAAQECPRVTEHDAIMVYRVMGAVDPSRRDTPGSAVKISEAEILRSIGASKTGEGEDEDTY